LKDYTIFYQQLTAPFRSRPQWVKGFAYFNRAMTLFMPLVYGLVLLSAYLNKGWKGLLAFILLPAIGFALLSAIRKRLNQARPYEKWAIQPLLAKDTSGKSMPSRHVFSSALISMCLFHFFWLPGLICLLLSAGLAIVRVIGGVHYPKDVLVGYLCGILWGSILFLL
jgi:PAP2 family protein